MYEINKHEKNLKDLHERLKASIEKQDCEGIIVVTVKKSQEAQVDAVFGDLTQFTWIGVMDYVVDVIKMQSSEEEES